MAGCEQLIERLRRSTLQVLNGRGGGAGVAWSANGLIVTNAHVARSRNLEIIDATGRRSAARIVKHDRERDLALLETSVHLEPAIIGDSRSIRSGEIVVAIGHQLGITGAVAIGMIHAAGEKWIEADIRLAPGNSGGILANAAGQVIGINTMIFHGIGLAIPAHEVNRFLLESSRHARAA